MQDKSITIPRAAGRRRKQVSPPYEHPELPGVMVVSLIGGSTTLIDEADLAVVLAHNWSLCAPQGHTKYAQTNIFDEIRGGKRRYKSTYLHRLLMRPPEGMVVDHRNGDGLDNRRCNLRVVTHAHNIRENRWKRQSDELLRLRAILDQRGIPY